MNNRQSGSSRTDAVAHFDDEAWWPSPEEERASTRALVVIVAVVCAIDIALLGAAFWIGRATARYAL